MKNITAFYMNGCPYCKGAKEALAELIEENPAYRQVAVDWYEESEHPEVVQGHSYYYVPSMFIGTENSTKPSRASLMTTSRPMSKRPWMRR